MDQDTTTERRNTAIQLTATQLKARGWTDTLIRDLLGAPDQTRINPHHRKGRRIGGVGRSHRGNVQAEGRRGSGGRNQVRPSSVPLGGH